MMAKDSVETKKCGEPSYAATRLLLLASSLFLGWKIAFIVRITPRPLHTLGFEGKPNHPQHNAIKDILGMSHEANV